MSRMSAVHVICTDIADELDQWDIEAIALIGGLTPDEWARIDRESQRAGLPTEAVVPLFVEFCRELVANPA